MILPGAAASKKVGKPKKASKNEEGHKYCFDGAMSKDQFGIVIVFFVHLGKYELPSANCMVSNLSQYPPCHLDVAFYRGPVWGD